MMKASQACVSLTKFFTTLRIMTMQARFKKVSTSNKFSNLKHQLLLQGCLVPSSTITNGILATPR
jgi:hypothetical protein